MVDEASTENPRDLDTGEPGADDQGDVYGIISDIDALEEMIEELDDLTLTTRDEVDQALALAQERIGNRVADDRASRLEDLLAAMRDFGVMSREDIVAKMADMDAEAEAIESGEDPLES